MHFEELKEELKAFVVNNQNVLAIVAVSVIAYSIVDYYTSRVWRPVDFWIFLLTVSIVYLVAYLYNRHWTHR